MDIDYLIDKSIDDIDIVKYNDYLVANFNIGALYNEFLVFKFSLLKNYTLEEYCKLYKIPDLISKVRDKNIVFDDIKKCEFKILSHFNNKNDAINYKNKVLNDIVLVKKRELLINEFPSIETHVKRKPKYKNKTYIYKDGEREKVSKRLSELKKTPEHIAKIKASMLTSESRELRSSISKKVWENTDIRKKISIKQKERWKERREKLKDKKFDTYILGSDGFGHWKLSENLKFDNKAFGFIYLIESNIDGKKIKYIGKKQMLTGKSKTLLETNWKSYTSSSVYINEVINKHGINACTFTILMFGYSKSHLAYLETREHFIRNVYLNDEYVNGIINCRLGKSDKLIKNLNGINTLEYTNIKKSKK